MAMRIRHYIRIQHDDGNTTLRVKNGLFHPDGRRLPYESEDGLHYKSPSAFAKDHYLRIRIMGLRTPRGRANLNVNGWTTVYYENNGVWNLLDNLRVNKSSMGPYYPSPGVIPR
jgi:hypothetical protein